MTSSYSPVSDIGENISLLYIYHQKIFHFSFSSWLDPFRRSCPVFKQLKAIPSAESIVVLSIQPYVYGFGQVIFLTLVKTDATYHCSKHCETYSGGNAVMDTETFP